MARATYEDLALIIVTGNEGKPRNKKYIVCPPSASEPDMALTVYPPTSYRHDLGIDVYFDGNTAELWQDGYKLRKLNSIQDADAVAKVIIEEIEKTEKIFLEEQ
jgi:hypothetical protein